MVPTEKHSQPQDETQYPKLGIFSVCPPPIPASAAQQLPALTGRVSKHDNGGIQAHKSDLSFQEGNSGLAGLSRIRPSVVMVLQGKHEAKGTSMANNPDASSKRASTYFDMKFEGMCGASLCLEMSHLHNLRKRRQSYGTSGDTTKTAQTNKELATMWVSTARKRLSWLPIEFLIGDPFGPQSQGYPVLCISRLAGNVDGGRGESMKASHASSSKYGSETVSVLGLGMSSCTAQPHEDLNWWASIPEEGASSGIAAEAAPTSEEMVDPALKQTPVSATTSSTQESLEKSGEHTDISENLEFSLLELTHCMANPGCKGPSSPSKSGRAALSLVEASHRHLPAATACSESSCTASSPGGASTPLMLISNVLEAVIYMIEGSAALLSSCTFGFPLDEGQVALKEKGKGAEGHAGNLADFPYQEAKDHVNKGSLSQELWNYTDDDAYCLSVGSLEDLLARASNPMVALHQAALCVTGVQWNAASNGASLDQGIKEMQIEKVMADATTFPGAECTNMFAEEYKVKESVATKRPASRCDAHVNRVSDRIDETSARTQSVSSAGSLIQLSSCLQASKGGLCAAESTVCRGALDEYEAVKDEESPHRSLTSGKLTKDHQ
ncbi:hypothetical protein cyc_02808 [Cyclospora cayetanensis]|uniref:Uncharacterized protein n=1 Tax=Cyclospora cayetanensis TaxID=88456 RepID=A0A1D3DAW7_9EIME|nr:hypothetical protein cyc_02808 [Cyclospora cayetanensis]